MNDTQKYMPYVSPRIRERIDHSAGSPGYQVQQYDNHTRYHNQQCQNHHEYQNQLRSNVFHSQLDQPWNNLQNSNNTADRFPENVNRLGRGRGRGVRQNYDNTHPDRTG